MRRREFVGTAGTVVLWGCHRGTMAAGLPIAGPPAHRDVRDLGDEVAAKRGSATPGASSPYASLHGFCDGVAAPDDAEFAARRARVASALRQTDREVLLVEAGPNMQYLSGVRWGLSERPFLLLLGRDGDVGWVCPAFEARRAREQVGEAANLRLWEEHEDPFAMALAIARTRTLGVDTDARGFIYEGLRRAAGKGASRIDVSAEAIVATRMRKQPAEVDRLRRANEATKAAIGLAAQRLGEGMLQSEFAAEVVLAQQAAGLDGVWALALFGPSAAFPHGTDVDRPLSSGDLVLVDTGGGLHGYRSDISRTWSRGPVPAELREAWSLVAEAQAAALEKIKVGSPCSLPDEAARRVFERAGFGGRYEHFTHRLGHGIGLSVHEEPYLRPQNPLLLDVGMTMSNEPGLYRPGAWGIRIEDIVAVTSGAPEVFGPPVGSFEDALAGHGAGSSARG